MEQLYKIYMLYCPMENIPRYIGLTGQSIEKRLKNHLGDKRNSPHKTRWIEKVQSHGFKPICVSLLENLTEKEAQKFEIIYIKMFRSFYGKKMTNISSGGEITTKEAIKKIKKQKGWKHTKEAKEKMSKVKLGKPTGPFTQERKNKISRAQKGKMNKSSFERQKPVVQFDTSGDYIKSFPSVSSAAREINASISQICATCNGKFTHTKGFLWFWENEDNSYDLENKIKKYSNRNKCSQETKKRLSLHNSKKITVVDISNNKTLDFISTNAVAKEFGVSSTTIKNLIRGKRVFKGMRFFHNEENKL